MDIEPKEPKEIPFRDIFKAVCKHYSVTMLDVISTRRSPPRLAQARHMIVQIALTHTRLSMNQIASKLSRTRWTILASAKKGELLLKIDQEFVSDLASLKLRLEI